MGRFALHGIAAAAVCATLLLSPEAQALGLGRLAVQSALGETLRAEIDVSSLTAEEASTLKVKVASPETYRAAGVDYNTVLPSTAITLQRRPDGRSFLQLSSDRPVQEPFVDVILELSWSTGRLVREYTLLFDPPTQRSSVAAAPTAPALGVAPPAPAPVAAPAPAPVRVEPSPAPAPRVAPPAPPAVAATPAPAPAPAVEPPAPRPRTEAAKPAPRAAAPEADANEVTVRRGDTLSRIASRVQRPGVSLDQMLVGLYRANPDAFVGENMNRLKSGVVLSVPSAEQLEAVPRDEARQVIQAQSSDFDAYRQRLATGVSAAAVDKPQRQATGQVQAEVQDRKQSGAPAPDKLTLSKGGIAAQPGTDDKLAKERAQKDSATRVAELSKNLQELKKLQGAASGAPAAATPPKPAQTLTPAPTPAPVPPAPAPVPPAPAPVAKPASAPAPAPVPAATTPASAPALQQQSPAPVASAPASAVAASAVAASAVEPASQASDAAVAAPVASAAASEGVGLPVAVPAPVAPPPPPPAPVEEPAGPGVLAGLLENPMVLLGGGVIVALLAGLGIYVARSRRKPESGETSFLESRLQPDSFFGASGGQRIDTRDASGAPSSMSYSLSQLDAIGDVDPVAEADVYLAYGRDLQAEEILKEALRSTPERLAIRTKLLEVYAKRRDTKGFEQLAIQLYALTSGQGEDWQKAQELGASIDPDNPLYAPGGQPVNLPEGGAAVAEPFGAATMPHSGLPTAPAEYEPAAAPASEGLDLDLDIAAPEAAPAASFASVQPTAPDEGLSFDLPDVAEPPPAPAPAPASSGPLEFDLSDISLDLNAPAPAPTPVAEPESLPDLASLDLGDGGAGEIDAADPMARKIELAEEFRQIGDIEGARDLLQEVVSKADGAVRAKAQRMLDELG